MVSEISKLNPLDVFVWAHVKFFVYQIQPKDMYSQGELYN